MNFWSIYILIGVIVSMWSATRTFIKNGSVFECTKRHEKIAELIGYIGIIFAWPLTLAAVIVLLLFMKKHDKNK